LNEQFAIDVGVVEPGARVHRATFLATYSGLLPESFLEGLTHDVAVAYLTSYLQAGAEALIARIDGRCVGTALGGPFRRSGDPATAEIYSLYVATGHQRSGVGRVLLCRLFERFRKRGWSRVIVRVVSSNPAVEFYRHTGALDVGRQAVVYGDTPVEECLLEYPDLNRCATQEPPQTESSRSSN
jgi:ribosomal protein S18 acetylase RimI-like enzyme